MFIQRNTIGSKLRYFYDIHYKRFSGKNIPVTAVAKIMGKDQQFVRQAMIEGLLPIGVAFRKKGSSQYDFYVSPKLLYDFTGFFFDEDLMEEIEVSE